MNEKVTDIKNKLFEAFQEDHAQLGQGLYEIRMELAEGNAEAIRNLAADIISTAGAHIAFEEYDFYPTLKAHLSPTEIKKMYLEHAQGLALLEKLVIASDKDFQSVAFIERCLNEIDILDHHVADCGNLFGAMGGLSDEDYQRLMQRLAYWREQAPVWSDVAKLTG